jgi:serine/threonine protein kinase
MLERRADRPVIKILDFGLAKASRESPLDSGLTSPDQMLGTPAFIAPELVKGDVVAVLDATKQTAAAFRWEYEVLRLGRRGLRSSFSLPRLVYGDNLLTDLRVGPDGNLFQLASSPQTGVTIDRYSLG